MYNQYPLDFIEPIINSTLKSIIDCPTDDNVNMSTDSEHSDSFISNDNSLDSNACLNHFEEKDKFNFLSIIGEN